MEHVDFSKIHRNIYLPFLAAKWTWVYKNLPEGNKKRFISFQLSFLAAKWSGVNENFPFWTSHISYGSKTWTLRLKQKILKLLFDVLHFILLPLCGCFTNKFIIKSRKSLVVPNKVAFVFYLFYKIYKFSGILAIPFSLEDVIKGITSCLKVPWF